MFGWSNKGKVRRRQVREQRVKTTGTARTKLVSGIFCWPVLFSVAFTAAAVITALIGETGIEYAVGQRIEQPIYAKVDFELPDVKQTEAARQAARAKTPSFYTPNPQAITRDRVSADLMRLYQAAADAETFEAYAQTLKQLEWPAEREAYETLRSLSELPEDAGRERLKEWVAALPLQQQYVVRDLLEEARSPRSATDYMLLEVGGGKEAGKLTRVRHSELVQLGSEKALRGAAAEVARRIPRPELRSTVETIVLNALKEQPTIVYNQRRTEAAMRQAAEATEQVVVSYAKDQPFVHPGVLGSDDYAKLRAHHAAFEAFLQQDVDEARRLRQEQFLQRVGLATLVAMLSVALLGYVGVYQRRVFEVRTRTLAFGGVILGTLAASRALVLHWPDVPELVLFPSLLLAMVLAIAYPRRFTMGAMCIAAVMVAPMIRADVVLLIVIFAGLAVAVFRLDDIRSRTKLINTGALTALVILLAACAGGFFEAHPVDYIWIHAGSASACAILAALVVSGLLPYIEKMFRIATSLTLLEWRDPTKPLLQLLAREAPGTYNHSLVLGTLAEAACERIGANGLLAQVGALYHDIGKIHKADYFTENQVGSTSRHENLSPTMSLLIILGHVKDGIEMAKEYKLPRVLHQFIEEHHGTTVVRYFHHMASEKRVAQGRHDREVPEAEFRYSGPKPRTKESAVLMLCDGVEGAVRSLHEPTVGRIESVVHQVVMARLNDGQFDDCDITLREIRLVEESLVKSLCSLYHGRVAYPKKQQKTEKPELKLATGQ